MSKNLCVIADKRQGKIVSGYTKKSIRKVKIFTLGPTNDTKRMFMKNFIPYGQQWITEDDKRAVLKVLGSDFLTQGPKVEEFEKAICVYTGAKYCVAVSNGTAALHLAVLALDLKPDAEGITTPNTFVASANCLVYAGLRPVFADIDERTYNINPNEIKKKITRKTKVIVTVDFTGRPADMKRIYNIAKQKKIHIIEDASHAIGSRYDSKYKVGSCRYCDLTTFSFHPVKTITCGEGGAITTNKKSLYEKLKLLRCHGIAKDQKILAKKIGSWYYEMRELGYNYRLTDLQAAIGISQLKKINRFIKRRRAIVKKYNAAFKNIECIIIPPADAVNNSACHLYVVQIAFGRLGKTRKQVMEELRNKHIGTQVHYIPVHLQPYYQKQFGYKEGDFPVAEAYYAQALSLPLYPKMTNYEINYVIKAIKNVIGK